MTEFITADPHFLHEAIIESCNRPFKNCHVMNRSLVSNWNSVVTDNDDVYVAGDLTMATKAHRGTIEQIVNRLKGRIHLVLGNHDIPDARFWSEIGIWSVHFPYFELHEFVIVHDPALSAVDRKRPFLCGHVHDLFTFQKNVLNVGMDIWEYKPISLNDVRHFFLGTHDDEPEKLTISDHYINLIKERAVRGES